MTPSAAFTFPGEKLVILQPQDVVVRIQPCGIFVGKDIFRCGAADSGDPYFVGILFPVQLLDEQFIAFRDKIHAGDVIVAGISGDIDPGSCSSFSRDVSYFYGRIGSTGFRIGKMLDGWIDGVYIIDNIEYTCPFRVALPVGYVLTVRTPAETVAAAEFFFIYPVERAVYNCLTSIAG